MLGGMLRGERSAKDDDSEAKAFLAAPNKPAKPPRRDRSGATDSTSTVQVDETASEKATAKDTGDAAAAAPAGEARGRRRRAADEGSKGGGDSGGWMSSPTKRTTASLVIEEDDPKDAPAASTKNERHFQEDNDEIIVIPDLDEDGADADQRVAHAPRNVTRKIPTLADLENDVKSAIPSVEGGYDLGVLLSTLVPASLVQEADVPWTFESLLRVSYSSPHDARWVEIGV